MSPISREGDTNHKPKQSSKLTHSRLSKRTKKRTASISSECIAETLSHPTKQQRLDESTEQQQQQQEQQQQQQQQPNLHQCPHCHESFQNQTRLEHHNRQCHSELRPYICSDCQASFLRKHDLTRHIRSIHMDKKNFSCKVCMRSYARSDALRRHLASVAHRESAAKSGQGHDADTGASANSGSRSGDAITTKESADSDDYDSASEND
eukprot:jgi/Hompol1/4455/HPOL_007111-RA